MTDDFRDDPAFLRDEVKRRAALATGAMREADGWKRLADDNGAEAMRRGKEVVALREQLAGAVSALQSIYDRHHMNGDGSAGQVSSDALRALGIDPDAGEQ
jgi:hypothetical protein